MCNTRGILEVTKLDFVNSEHHKLDDLDVKAVISMNVT